MHKKILGLLIGLLLLLAPPVWAQTSLHDIPGSHIENCWVEAAAAGTDKKGVCFESEWNITVTSVAYYAVSAITGTNTNFADVKVINGGTAGAGTTVIANKQFTNGVDATALDATTLTLSGTTANLNVDAGEEVLYFSDQSNGSGAATPKGLVRVEYKFR